MYRRSKKNNKTHRHDKLRLANWDRFFEIGCLVRTLYRVARNEQMEMTAPARIPCVSVNKHVLSELNAPSEVLSGYFSHRGRLHRLGETARPKSGGISERTAAGIAGSCAYVVRFSQYADDRFLFFESAMY